MGDGVWCLCLLAASECVCVHRAAKSAWHRWWWLRANTMRRPRNLSHSINNQKQRLVSIPFITDSVHSRTTCTAWISINQHELNLHTECTLHTWLVVTGPKILYTSETFTRLACIFNALYAVAHNQLVYFLFARFANQSVICYFANAKFQNWNDDQFLLFYCEIESVEVWLRCTSCLLPWCMCRICCCCCC